MEKTLLIEPHAADMMEAAGFLMADPSSQTSNGLMLSIAISLKRIADDLSATRINTGK